MTQVNIIHSVTVKNVCSDCKDFLNAAQCNVSKSKVTNLTCTFINDTCTTLNVTMKYDSVATPPCEL